jgi:1,4-alpha-glucan branching enzyme
MMIAEESTAWPMMTHRVEDGGLGFDFKWNMGWMNDFLNYISLDPLYRKYHHNELTFSMVYAYSENFILVLSHDEVVHEKRSMIEKMPGGYEDKFSNLRAAYGYMATHPGKKLLFMGQEFAQDTEWSEDRELDWSLLGDELHSGMRDYVRELLKLYKTYPCLYELDHENEGFSWINADDTYKSIYSFVRYDRTKKKSLLFVMNFTPIARDDYRVGTPKSGKYKLLLSSDEKRFGGNSDTPKKKTYTAEKISWDGQDYSIAYPLPAYGAAVFEF